MIYLFIDSVAVVIGAVDTVENFVCFIRQSDKVPANGWSSNPVDDIADLGAQANLWETKTVDNFVCPVDNLWISGPAREKLSTVSTGAHLRKQVFPQSYPQAVDNSVCF